jgi:hypothetical protein
VWVGQVALTAGPAGAVDAWYPKVSRARVQDDLELLRGCSNADDAYVDQLPWKGMVSASLVVLPVP